MRDNSISFAWTYPKNRDGNIIAYCFAYVRNKGTNGVLYGGVRFEGLECELGKYRSRLRMTALKRLIKKPIYGVYVANEEVVGDRKHRFNGFENGDKQKITSSMAKFFVSCGMDKFANVGLCCKKGEADFMMKVDNGVCKEVKNGGNVFVRYGYIWDGKEMKRVIAQGTYGFGNGNEQIVGLYNSAKFYGKEKERRSLCDFGEISEEFLLSFGVGEKKIKKENGIKLEDYHRNGDYVYYRAKLSNTKRVHIVFTNFDSWMKMVSEIYEDEYWTNEDMEGVVCMAYSVEDINGNDCLSKNGRRYLHKKIAVDRMVHRPNMMYIPEEMDMKEKRMWFYRRIGIFKPEGERKFCHFDGEIVLDSELVLHCFRDYNEQLDVYNFAQYRELSFWERLMKTGEMLWGV